MTNRKNSSEKQENVVKLLKEYAAQLGDRCAESDSIQPSLYEEYGVNLGLRDKQGNGVLTGLTNISKITSFTTVNGVKEPAEGQLWYRGYKIRDIINSFKEDELGFEKVAYLLLIGEMPDSEEYRKFRGLIGECRTLPTNFVRDVIMKAPTEDIMNSMTKSILTLSSYDKQAKDTSLDNVIRQSIQLISAFPLLAVYGYKH